MELMLYKKPDAELEVIDEYDGMFDSLYFDEVVCFTRLGRLYPREEDASKGGDSLMDIFRKKNELASRINRIAKEADADKTWVFIEELRDFCLDVLRSMTTRRSTASPRG
jgi:hypothetical protein